MRRPGCGRSSITVVAVSRVGLKAAVNERRTTWPTRPYRRTAAAELNVLGVDLVQEVRLARHPPQEADAPPPTQPDGVRGRGWGLGTGRERHPLDHPIGRLRARAPEGPPHGRARHEGPRVAGRTSDLIREERSGALEGGS